MMTVAGLARQGRCEDAGNHSDGNDKGQFQFPDFGGWRYPDYHHGKTEQR